MLALSSGLLRAGLSLKFHQIKRATRSRSDEARIADTAIA